MEKSRQFDTDVEDDPVAPPLDPDFDYLRKKLPHKIMQKFANRKGDAAIDKLFAARQIIVKEVVGIENLNAVKGAAFVTSNHFHPFENMALYKVFKQNDNQKRMFWRIIREGNYTAPPKGFDLFFRHCNTLPLCSSPRGMRNFLNAVETLTKGNNLILVYPEQYMWWNFRKPRPFKVGTFRFAARFGKPVLPCFITMSNSDVLDADGLPVQEYTIHVLPPIHPDPSFAPHENEKNMMVKNFRLAQETYEKTYGVPLRYEG